MVDRSDPDLAVVAFDPKRVVVLVGPTSSGKTALSLRLAARFPVELVCMDSMQLYRELEVGTARPTAKQLAGIPHHLFGTVSIREPMSAYRYTVLASAAIAEIQSRGRIPLLVGGTGLYLRALFEGLDPLPPTPPDLRARLDRSAERHGKAWLYRLLARLDPRGAAHLHPNDHQRIQRFLEVRLITKRAMLDHWSQQRIDLAEMPLTIGLEIARPILDQRIRAAVEDMLAGGWIAETRALLGSGLYARVREIAPIGYDEVAALIEERRGIDEVRERIYRATRRYAKRQMTWFRKASYIRWFPFDPESGYNITGIAEVVQGSMG